MTKEEFLEQIAENIMGDDLLQYEKIFLRRLFDDFRNDVLEYAAKVIVGYSVDSEAVVAKIRSLKSERKENV